MNMQPDITQSPLPGKSKVMYCGDCVTFTLTLSSKISGAAFVRTNIGSVSTARKEIIRRVEYDEIKLDEAWQDIKMEQQTPLTYKIALPLTQTGFFQAKCFFIPDDTETPLWPIGDNCILNVAPPGTCCANIIYNAFVRLFGKSKSNGSENKALSSAVKQLDENGYTAIPESGKFRDLIKEIPFIFNTLGCRVLHLLPVHPTPTVFGRMGRFGSPYAALNFTEVDPALAEFDPAATPLEQFMELVDTVHFHNGYIFMDIAINHTGWAASIHESHPEWLVRGTDGKIQAPGAWGVVWADLTKLDYTHTGLWKYMADVFLLWCKRGVDGFRCDAAYMVPVEAWEYIVAKTREVYPDILFFLEGLGGPVKTTQDILSRANFNWAYSELFQHYSKEEISHYLPQAFHTSKSHGHLIHFAETHDNNRLASVSITYARMRTALCALFSHCGGFGFANGVEWFAAQKINVHEITSLNWGNNNNQVDDIARLTLILKTHPTFSSQAKLKLIHRNDSNCLVLSRTHHEQKKQLLILVNLDCEKNQTARWSKTDTFSDTPPFFDLISSRTFTVSETAEFCQTDLSPGQVLALTPDAEDIQRADPYSATENHFPHLVYLQKLKAKILSIFVALNGYRHINETDLDRQAERFAKNPIEFMRSLNGDTKESRVIVFDCEKDLNRQVMIPPGYFLLVCCKNSFRSELIDENKAVFTSLRYEEGLPQWDTNTYFSLFLPPSSCNHSRPCSLLLRIFTPEGTQVKKASLLFLTPFKNLHMNMVFTRREILNSPFLKLLGTTKKGGMMRAAAWWRMLDSRYDALLGANLDTSLPENRWMVLSRYRIWAIFQGYSRELTLDCLEQFAFSYTHGGKWLFHVPTSEGHFYAIELHLTIDSEQNLVNLNLARLKSKKTAPLFLNDNKPITLIVRPDIEDRCFHDTVKAFKGPEHEWPKAIQAGEKGFLFRLSKGPVLTVESPSGTFVQEPEWHYMVHRPQETQRGQDADSDLFSPGYFTISCNGGDCSRITASVNKNQITGSDFVNKKARPDPSGFPQKISFSDAIYKSLDAFLVNRGKDKSVIAGYPWFLDWGRDSLIFCRALIELERFSDAKAILRLFGRHESNGTLPNMLCGEDARNIETSDAPLWFFTCCKDLIEKEKTDAFLLETIGDRSVREILLSIAHSFIHGTRTGVIVDPETMLVFSPAHFTWMDTNFPAGSPRNGYPIEIQALWFNALKLLSRIDAENTTLWQDRARIVQQAIVDLFYNRQAGFFSDCLHSNHPAGARAAVPDDALRPNQLFLFTFEIVTDPLIARQCIETCQELLIPGAIRSLADRPLETPIHILYNDKLLKDPFSPYSGTYQGDEDTRRKPAYHNGTAWTWPFPVFCEAWAAVFGKKSIPTCLAWLGSAMDLMRKGAAGYIPEILDGDFPHTPRGCDAQAWGSSEVARVVHKLHH